MNCNFINHYIAILCEQRRLAFAEKNTCQTITSCKDFDDQNLKRQNLKMFKSLQLLLTEMLICNILIETVDDKRINQ